MRKILMRNRMGPSYLKILDYRLDAITRQQRGDGKFLKHTMRKGKGILLHKLWKNNKNNKFILPTRRLISTYNKFWKYTSEDYEIVEYDTKLQATRLVAQYVIVIQILTVHISTIFIVNKHNIDSCVDITVRISYSLMILYSDYWQLHHHVVLLSRRSLANIRIVSRMS